MADPAIDTRIFISRYIIYVYPPWCIICEVWSIKARERANIEIFYAFLILTEHLRSACCCCTVGCSHGAWWMMHDGRYLYIWIYWWLLFACFNNAFYGCTCRTAAVTAGSIWSLDKAAKFRVCLKPMAPHVHRKIVERVRNEKAIVTQKLRK